VTDKTPAATADEPVELDEQTAGDVARLAELNRQAVDLKEAAEEIKTRLRERLHVGRRYRYAGREVLDLGKIGSQFDATLAEMYVPDPLFDTICTPRPDKDKAERILPAELFAKCCKPKAAAVKPL
jgi:uncharacterized protein YbjT (DUF2867 family)